MSISSRLFPCAALIAALSLVSAADAALPDLPDTWLNSGPLSAQALQGKVVVFYFYEEDCPRCRGYWPSHKSVADSLKDEPIIFIAVNSGNSESEVKSYLQGVKVDWPTIVDTPRTFEKSMNVGVISLQNIGQFKIYGADGNPYIANLDLKGATKAAVADAKWIVDPAEVPAAMKPYWRAFEFGDYQTASPLLAKAKTTSSDPFFKKIAETVEAVIADRTAAAQALESKGETWPAYKGYAALVRDFGSSKAKEAASAASKLKRDPTVKQEMQAATIFAQLQSMMETLSTKKREAAEQGFEQLAAKFPDTEAGRAAAARGK